MAHTADDNRKLPKYVTIDCVQLDEVDRKIIYLDDRLKRMIVEKTWDGDLTKPRLISGCKVPDMWVSDKQKEYCYLAHVGAKLSDVPCKECCDPWLSGCRINSLWPPNGSCTSCTFPGQSSKCSLCKSIAPLHLIVWLFLSIL